ncbi:MAG: universal stress protein [Chitinophagaceae bacterium]
MKKRFIVLIDFSDHSKHLLLLANTWAKKTNAEIVLVHQVIKPVPALATTDVIDKLKQSLKESALEELKSFASEVIDDSSTIRFLADTAHLISIIESLETPNTIDYIFVGVNDRSAIERLFLGNTASELSKQSDKILLAFPTTKTDISIDRLYVGVKEKYPINGKAFQNLIGILKDIISEIRFFSSLKPEEDQGSTEKYLQSLHTWYNDQVNSSYTIYRNEDPINTVKEYMVKNKGLLVIQKGSRTLADIFRKFWTTEMINSANIPVIILPNNN